MRLELEQKVFELGSIQTVDGKTTLTKPTSKQVQELRLVVNGTPTEVKLTELFKGNSEIGDDYIKGWSLLQHLKFNGSTSSTSSPTSSPTNKYYEILTIQSEDIKISFTDGTNSFSILKIRNPLFQFGDKVLNESEVEHYGGIIYAQVKMISDKAKAELDAKEATPELPQQAAASEAYDGSTSSPTYESDKKDLINEGYKEFKHDNHRALIKEDLTPILIEIKQDGSYSQIDEFEVINQDDKKLELKVGDTIINFEVSA